MEGHRRASVKRLVLTTQIGVREEIVNERIGSLKYGGTEPNIVKHKNCHSFSDYNIQKVTNMGLT